jgi:hypothetical protein
MMRIAIWTGGLLAMLYVALVSPAQGGLGGDEAHRVAFFLFGIITPLAWPRRSLWVIWLGLLCVAGGIELGQNALVAAELSAQRVGAWSDWWTSAIAASAGVACIAMLRALVWLARRLFARFSSGKAPIAPAARR